MLVLWFRFGRLARMIFTCCLPSIPRPGELLRPLRMDALADDAPPELKSLRTYRQAGRALVPDDEARVVTCLVPGPVLSCAVRLLRYRRTGVEDVAMHDPREGLDGDGTIRTGADRRRVPPAFEPIITALLDAFGEVGDDSAELHLYGSVANGTARAGRSDVDLVAIDVPQDWARRTGQRLSADFADLCRGIEIGPGCRSDYLGDGDEAYGNRVFLRHYCLPLAGPDALRSPTPFPGDSRAARGFNGDIGIRLERWRAGNPRARSVARKTLFAAAGVVSVVNRIWTTDRASAAQRWDEIEPGRAQEMAMLLAWADDDGTARAKDLAKALAPEGVVANVVNRFTQAIGLWP